MKLTRNDAYELMKLLYYEDKCKAVYEKLKEALKPPQEIIDLAKNSIGMLDGLSQFGHFHRNLDLVFSSNCPYVVKWCSQEYEF